MYVLVGGSVGACGPPNPFSRLRGCVRSLEIVLLSHGGALRTWDAERASLSVWSLCPSRCGCFMACMDSLMRLVLRPAGRCGPELRRRCEDH
eukprot:495310-Pleurochrysis_carterae.AAC.1